MVRTAFCYHRSGNSKEEKWFGLIKNQETKGIIMVLVDFLIKRQECQQNRIVWVVFCHQKSGNSRTYNGLGGLGCFVLSLAVGL